MEDLNSKDMHPHIQIYTSVTTNAPTNVYTCMCI